MGRAAHARRDPALFGTGFRMVDACGSLEGGKEDAAGCSGESTGRIDGEVVQPVNPEHEAVQDRAPTCQGV